MGAVVGKRQRSRRIAPDTKPHSSANVEAAAEPVAGLGGKITAERPEEATPTEQLNFTEVVAQEPKKAAVTKSAGEQVEQKPQVVTEKPKEQALLGVMGEGLDDALALDDPRPADQSGVRLGALEELLHENEGWLAKPVFKEALGCKRRPTMHEVVGELVKPRTRHRQCAYAELFEPAQPHVFVSHWWGEEFVLFMQALRKFATIFAPKHNIADPKDVVFWVCSFANRQWTVALGATLQQSPFEVALACKACKAVLMVLDRPATPLRRIWCLYEVLRAHALEKEFHMATENCILTHGIDEPLGPEAQDFVDLTRAVMSIDAKTASASVDSDRRMILSEVRHTVGIQQFTTHVKALLADAFMKRGGMQMGAQYPQMLTEISRLNQVQKLTVSFHGRTALHVAAQDGSVEEVEAALRELGTDTINATTALGQMPLHLAACFNSDSRVIEALLRAAADVNAADKNRYRPLQLAALGGRSEILSMLIEAGAKPDQGETPSRNSFPPMVLAAMYGHEGCITTLLQHDVAVNGFALAMLAAYGHVGALDLLLQAGMDPNGQEMIPGVRSATALTAAACAGHEACAAVLLKHRADVHLRGTQMNPLMLACAGGHERLAQLLLETPLMLACAGGHDRLVQVLLEADADPWGEANTEEGETPFTLACGGGHVACMRPFLERGVDINAKIKIGWTPLRTAAGWGRTSVVRVLVEERADVEAADSLQMQPLHVAARRGYAGTCRVLLQSRAEPEARDSKGWTPLDWAMDQEPPHIEVVNLLTLGEPNPPAP